MTKRDRKRISCANKPRRGNSRSDAPSGSRAPATPAPQETQPPSSAGADAETSTRERKKLSRRLLAGLWTIVIAAISGLAGNYLGIASERNQWPYSAPSAHDLAAELDGKFPTAECKANYANVFSAEIKDRTGQAVIATVQLRKGSDCGASWLWVSSSVADVVVTKSLSRAETDDLGAMTVTEVDPITTATGPDRESYTEQLYTTGCVTLEVSITDSSDAVVGALPLTEVCPS